jgi:hypothetical protein
MSDNISITPGAIFLFNPEGSDFDGENVIFIELLALLPSE